MGYLRVLCHSIAHLILLTVITKEEAFATGLGKCPVLKTGYVNITNLQRKWYEVERSFNVMEMATACNSFDVKFKITEKTKNILGFIPGKTVFYADESHMAIAITSTNRWTGIKSTLHGVGVFNHAGSTYFRFRRDSHSMPYPLGKLLPGAGLYQVLAVERNYAIIWSCTGTCFAHADNIWVLGDTRQINPHHRAEIYRILEKHKLDPDRLMYTGSHCDEGEFRNRWYGK